MRRGFEDHLEQTNGHIARLEQIFQKLGIKPAGKVCRAMEGLVAESEEMLQEDARPTVRDAGLISITQRVEHYEMAGYGCVRTYAQELGDSEAANLLQQTLDAESETNEKLTRLAERRVNARAMETAGSLR